MSGHVVVAVDSVIAAGIAAFIREAAEDWAPYAAKKAEEYAKALDSAVPVEESVFVYQGGAMVQCWANGEHLGSQSDWRAWREVAP